MLPECTLGSSFTHDGDGRGSNVELDAPTQVEEQVRRSGDAKLELDDRHSGNVRT
jgi:hypothetical protein